jgi:zeaxanthin glucosyltransferase
MAHFGVLSYEGMGHLNPLFALSKTLIARGHQVTFFLHSDFKEQVCLQGFGFVAVNPTRSVIAPAMQSGYILSRIVAIRDGVDRIAGTMEGFLHELPPLLRKSGVNVLIVSEIALCGPTVAEQLQLPYLIVSTTLPHNFGWNAPLSITPREPWLAQLQKTVLEVSVLRMRGPVGWRLDRYRRQIGLTSIRSIATVHPPLAHVTQMPACFDRPHSIMAKDIFYTGPFIDESARQSVTFPWEMLDCRPLIYASLGTTRKGDVTVFRRISEACIGLNAQLVISMGGRRNTSGFDDLPGNPIVVAHAPQLELIRMAQLVITHAGPNTVLESLMHGKPMVALPMVLDQPAIAARLAALNVAEVLSIASRSVDHIRSAVVKVLGDPSYVQAAQHLQRELQTADGLACAVDIVEDVIARHTFTKRAFSRSAEVVLLTDERQTLREEQLR